MSIVPVYEKPKESYFNSNLKRNDLKSFDHDFHINLKLNEKQTPKQTKKLHTGNIYTANPITP